MRSSLASAVVVGLAIGFVAVLLVVRPHRGGAADVVVTAGKAAVVHSPPPRTAPVAPEEVPSSPLFARNRDMPSDPDLAAEYDEINDEFFSNILPPPRTRWESGLAELGPAIAERFTVQGLTDGRIILINPAVEHNAEQRRRALCHEMVHVAVWPEDTGHGPIFQERLRQLSLRGAFKGIAATDEERDQALTDLHRRRAAIDSEDRALGADRDTLDRTSQAAVDAFNARVRVQRAAVAEYNRLVEQYNLMISYPDGLARERVQPRADGTRPDSR